MSRSFLFIRCSAVALPWLLSAGLVSAAEPAATQVVATQSQTAEQPATPPRTGEVLRSAVRASLKHASGGARDEATIRELVALYREVLANSDLPASTRHSLRIALRNRLLRLGAALQTEVAAAPRAVAPHAVRPAQPPVLAQVVNPAGAAARPTQPIDHGQELLELIQDTILPESWEARGGLGTIKYWPMGHAMVVRQTGNVHEQLGQLLMDLR